MKDSRFCERVGVLLGRITVYIMHMERRIFLALLALFFGISVTGPLMAEQLSLNALSNYLNSLKTAKGTFKQINPDKSLSKGVFYMSRPGRIRFEYSPPNNSLVVAGGGQVAIFDIKSNRGPQQYPLAKTPLNLILKRNVNLKRSGMVRKHGYDGTSTYVIAQDKAHPDYGSLKLVFSDHPTRLRQWVITDQTGKQTTVILGDLEKGLSLSPSLFSIVGISQQLGQE